MTASSPRRAVWIAAASPALLALFVVLRHGVDMPFMDQWAPDVAGVFVKAHAGSLELGDFLAQHNEHRMAVPRVLLFALGSLTHWNVKCEMLATWVVACVLSASLLVLARRTKGPGEGSGALPWFLANLLVFTPAQWENWLGGLGIANVLTTTLFVLTVVAVTSSLRPARKLVLAILLATAATFSTGSGVFVWPLCGLLLGFGASWKEVRPRSRILAVWAAAGLAAGLLYVRNYREPEHPPDSDAYLAGFGSVLHHFSVFLGGAFASSGGFQPLTTAAVVGAAMAVAFGFLLAIFLRSVLRHRDEDRSRRMAVWIAVAGYSLLSGLVAALFRAGFGAEQALGSRYILFSMGLPIALVHLVPIACEGVASARSPAFLGGAFLLLELLALPPGLAASRAVERSRREGKAALLLADVVRDDALLEEDVCFDPPSALATAHALDAMGFLRPPLVTGRDPSRRISPVLPAPYVGRLESSRQNPRGPCTVSGWALSADFSRAPDAVLVSYDDAHGAPTLFAFARAGLRREDFAGKGRDPRLVQSGWAVIFPASLLPASPATLRIRAWTMDVDTATFVELEGEAILAARTGG